MGLGFCPGDHLLWHAAASGGLGAGLTGGLPQAGVGITSGAEGSAGCIQIKNMTWLREG